MTRVHREESAFWPFIANRYFQKDDQGKWEELPHTIGKELYKQQEIEDNAAREERMRQLFYGG